MEGRARRGALLSRTTELRNKCVDFGGMAWGMAKESSLSYGMVAPKLMERDSALGMPGRMWSTVRELGGCKAHMVV